MGAKDSLVLGEGLLQAFGRAAEHMRQSKEVLEAIASRLLSSIGKALNVCHQLEADTGIRGGRCRAKRGQMQGKESQRGANMARFTQFMGCRGQER